MNFSMVVRMAFRAIGHHKGRSLLTVLGIVIGIAGIIATSAIGSGAQKKARDQILSYGERSIDVWAGNWAAHNKIKPDVPLTLQDVNTIGMQCKEIELITPLIKRNGFIIEFQGNKFDAEVTGARDCSFEINSEKAEQGNLFTHEHDMVKENVVVLNKEAADALFKWTSPVGQIIRVNKIPFKVIGVLAPPKVPRRWDIGKLKVTMPFLTAQKYFSYSSTKVDCISFSVYDEQHNEEVKRQVTRILRASHRLEDNDPNDFMVWDIQGMAEAAEGGSKIIGLFALIAASIALLVGGIGVMNIMLVAVQERTKEIGIKMALGAPGKTILRQFLLESVVLCMIGGLLGVGAGVGVAYALEHFSSLPAIIEMMPIIFGFFITIFIGLFFGYYPARRASLLDPVQALTEQ